MASQTIVLISGGNTGIGYEMVKKIAADHASTHQILMGTRSLVKGNTALEKLGSPQNVTPVELDITSDVSIEKAVKHISDTYGKLDVLINNAGTAGLDLGEPEEGTYMRAKGKTLREIYTHVYSVNCTSTAVLTESLTPLLDKSDKGAAKVIFISSTLGSIGTFMDGYQIIQCPWYNSSKAVVNYLAAWYSRTKPAWRVNAVCPGYNATGLNNAELNEHTDPKNGAARVCQLVAEGPDGATGTYSNTGGSIPW